MRFYVENAPNSSYTVAQFGRSTSAATTPAFGLNVTMTTEAPPNTPPTGDVTIFGTAAEDQILTAKNTLTDADGLGAISYQWSRNSVPVGGATGEQYTLTQADVGSQITLTATYQMTVALLRVLTRHQLLLCKTSMTGPLAPSQLLVPLLKILCCQQTRRTSREDGLGPFSYQWIRNGTQYGSNCSTYQLTSR